MLKCDVYINWNMRNHPGGYHMVIKLNQKLKPEKALYTIYGDA